MRRLRAPIRQFLPVLIGGVILSAASGAFAQNPTLNDPLNSYQMATTSWMGTLMNYATDLFVAFAGIEFAGTAIVLAMKQCELEGWIAAFLKKLMGISFFYAPLLKGPEWIQAIIDSFTQIGKNAGHTLGELKPDSVLRLGVQLGGQILHSPPASVSESIGSPISAGSAGPPPGTYDSPSSTQSLQLPGGGPQGGPPELSPVAKRAQMVSNGLHHLAGGLHSLENDGGGAPVSVPPPTCRSLRD